jgi:hypothetical protein
MTHQALSEEEIVARAYARLSAIGTAFVLGLLSGSGLFVATLWLVLKGGPHPGPHLGLLGQYFPGYAVTVGGSFVGFAYAFVVGAVAGFALAAAYNRLAR